MSATERYLERQNEALLELIEKKDAYITRLQDEVSQKSQVIHTVRAEQRNLANTVKEFVVECVKNDDMSQTVAESLSEICDFELTKTITVTATVDFEVEITIPLDADPDDVIASLEYSVDAFDYSIDDFSLDTRNVDWEETIS
jgi:hypothetical protein